MPENSPGEHLGGQLPPAMRGTPWHWAVLRQTLTSLPSSNAAFVKVMHQLGLSEEETERMMITDEQDHATDGLSLHFHHILQDMMQWKKRC